MEYRSYEQQYLEKIQEALSGAGKSDRTGTGTTSIHGVVLTADLSKEFPLLTTKKVFTKAVFAELAWFLRGSSNNNELKAMGASIWDEWADEAGNLGPIYGVQWRSWDANGVKIDQIAQALSLLKKDPFSRRIIVSAWNVADLPKMALSPCHVMFQFLCSLGKDGRYVVDLIMYQRSADAFLGVPFNAASYAALLHIFVSCLGSAYRVGKFIHMFGDFHVYLNHREQVALQQSREMLDLPNFELSRELVNPWDFDPENDPIVSYKSWPAISAPVAV